MRAPRSLALPLAGALASCGDGVVTNALPAPADAPARRPTNVDVDVIERAPVSLAPLPLPPDVTDLSALVAPDGRVTVVARDGRFFSVDSYGNVTPVERAPEGASGPTDEAVTALIERAPGEPLAVTTAGALGVSDGWVQRVALPSMLRGARARGAWDAASLWATGTGVYTSQEARWLRLDRGGEAVTDARAALPLRADASAREAWVLHGDGALELLRVAGERVAWSAPVEGFVMGRVRAVARHLGARYVAREGDLLRVTAGGAIERVRVPGVYAGPAAMASAGPWLWMVWSGDTEALVARYDGARALEVLGRGGPLRAPAVSADSERGDVAVITDGATATRVVVETAVRVTGIRDGEVVTEPRVALTVEPPAPWRVEGVDFSLDGVRVTTVVAAPFAWGDGRALRELPTLEFGPHAVSINVRYRGATPVRLTRAFRYASPIGRAPTWETDILPLYEANCARCHSTGVARDLRGYARFSAQATAVLNAMQARRMPPDFSVDAQTVQVVTAWIGGGLRER